MFLFLFIFRFFFIVRSFQYCSFRQIYLVSFWEGFARVLPDCVFTVQNTAANKGHFNVDGGYHTPTADGFQTISTEKGVYLVCRRNLIT